MIADISSGHHAFADVMFLVAFILALLAGLAAAKPLDARLVVLGWFAVAALSLGFLVL